MKADFLLSLCELIVGGKEGLQPIEKTVIDRCVRLVYREMALGLETAKTPLLQDLYEELLHQPGAGGAACGDGVGALLHRLSQPL